MRPIFIVLASLGILAAHHALDGAAHAQVPGVPPTQPMLPMGNFGPQQLYVPWKPTPPRRGHYEGGDWYWDEPDPNARRSSALGHANPFNPTNSATTSGFRPKRPGHYEGGQFFYDDTLPPKVSADVRAPRTNPGGKVRQVDGDGAIDGPAEQDIMILLNPATSPSTALLIMDRVVQHGLDTVPVLLAYLDDTRTYGTDAFFQSYRAPATEGAIKVVDRRVKVGDVAAMVLYQVVRPRGTSAYERAVAAQGPQMFVVKDWHRWWTAHRELPVATIRSRATRLVDRYFQQNGRPPVFE